MKKSISLLLAVIMIVSMLPMAVFAESDPAIVFSTDFDNDLEIGDTFTVTAEMANNPGFAAVKLSLGWNSSAVSFTGFDTDDGDIISDVLWGGVTVNHTEGIITGARDSDRTKNGALFTANFTIVGEGSLDITLKQSDTVTLYQMKNAAGDDVNFKINLSALNGLTVGGKAVGPAIPEDAPFTAITTNVGAVIAIDQQDDVDGVPYYIVTIPEGATTAYVTAPDQLVMEDEYTGAMQATAYASDRSFLEGPLYISYNYEETADGPKVEIPMNMVATGWGGEAELDFINTHAFGIEDAGYACLGWISFVYDDGAEEEETYSITVDENIVGGTVTAYDEDENEITKAAEGDAVLLIPTASLGYEFDHFLVNGEPVDVGMTNGFYTMPAGDVTISAVFTAIDYTVTVTQPDNGTVEANFETAPMGTEVTLTATPNEGYEFVSYTVMCGSNSVTVTDGKFIMPAGNVTVTAEFTAETLYGITVTQPEGGSVSTEPVAQAKAGASVTVNAVADEGYELEAIYVNGEEISSNTFEMPEDDVVVTAEFSLKEYDITVIDPDNGTVTADSTATMGEVVNLSYEADAGYKFVRYIVECGGETVAVTDNAFTMPAGDVTVTAVFAKKSEGYTFAVSADGSANNGETAVVKVMITGHSDANVTGYNAYDITLNYDSSKLEFVDYEGAVKTDNGEVEPDGDTIHIVGCGAFKSFAQNDVVAAITFRVKPEAQGSANVTIEKVQVSDKETAVGEDAPEATPGHKEGDVGAADIADDDAGVVGEFGLHLSQTQVKVDKGDDASAQVYNAFAV